MKKIYRRLNPASFVRYDELKRDLRSSGLTPQKYAESRGFPEEVVRRSRTRKGSKKIPLIFWRRIKPRYPEADTEDLRRYHYVQDATGNYRAPTHKRNHRRVENRLKDDGILQPYMAAPNQPHRNGHQWPIEVEINGIQKTCEKPAHPKKSSYGNKFPWQHPNR